MEYKFDVRILEESGYSHAMLGLSLNKNQDPDKMDSVARKLAPLDYGHNKFLESMQVWLDITAPRYWWQEFDTYRVGTSKQSQSTMHTILKNQLTQDNFEMEISQSYLDFLNEIFKTDELIKLKQNLPEGFLQRRIVSTNYKSLKNMITQRKSHRLPHWIKFCKHMEENLKHYYLFGFEKKGTTNG